MSEKAPPTRPDFQHVILRTEGRQCDDLADDVRIDEKILAESLQYGRKRTRHGRAAASQSGGEVAARSRLASATRYER